VVFRAGFHTAGDVAVGVLLFNDAEEAVRTGTAVGSIRSMSRGIFRMVKPCYGALKFQHRSGAVKGKRSIRPPTRSLTGKQT
jgi:hypothetical protein